jgi:predicted nucleic acid-binding Zn ribbon protein
MANKCKLCGKEFIPNYYSKRRQQFCSNSCYSLYYSEIRRIKTMDMKIKMNRKCMVCNKPIPLNRTLKVIFCSKKCYVNRKLKLRIGRKCIYCSKSIPISRDLSVKYCSKECQLEQSKKRSRDIRRRL